MELKWIHVLFLSMNHFWIKGSTQMIGIKLNLFYAQKLIPSQITMKVASVIQGIDLTIQTTKAGRSWKPDQISRMNYTVYRGNLYTVKLVLE